jgi:hypothetical protein
LDVDVQTLRDRVLALFAVVGPDDDFAGSLDDLSVVHRAVDFRHHGRVLGVPGFEEIDDARKTAGDVLGLRRGARDFDRTSPSRSGSPSRTMMIAWRGIRIFRSGCPFGSRTINWGCFFSSWD